MNCYISICHDRNYMDAATCAEIDHSIFSVLAVGVAVVWCFMHFILLDPAWRCLWHLPLKQGWLWYPSGVLGSTPFLNILPQSHAYITFIIFIIHIYLRIGFLILVISIPSSFLQKSRWTRLFLFPSRYIQTLLSTWCSSISSCSSYLHCPQPHPAPVHIFHCPSPMGNMFRAYV